MNGSLVKGVLNFEIQKDATVEFHWQVLYQTVIFETGRWGAIIWSSDSELGEIQWMGLQQPAGQDYVQSKEYRLYCIVQSYLIKCQKLGKSSHGEIQPKIFDFETGLVSRYGDFPNFWHLI